MMPDKEPEKNRGVSITKPELPLDRFMDAFGKSRLGKAFAAVTGITLVVASTETACANTQPTTQPAETAPVPSGFPTEAPTIAPTAENTPVPPTPVVTPERPEASGGLYTAEQMVDIEGGKFAVQEQVLADWTKDIWTHGSNRAFAPETTRLNFVYFFDPKNPDSAGVCLESPDYPGVCMIMPLDKYGNPLPTPTTMMTTPDIPEGMGPTMLSLDMDENAAKLIDPINWPQLADSVLGWSDGGWVRMINGKVTVKEKGTWRVKIDYNQAFFDPQSEADFPKVIESFSPIDDPADFAVWQEGYLAAVNEKLKTWTGPSVYIFGSGIHYDKAVIAVYSNSWPVIASYKFTWQGQEILTKTYVADDGQGNLVPLSLTYPTPNSDWFATETGYNDPPGGKGVCYEWTSETAKYVDDKFAASFMPNGQNYTDFDSMKRFIIGTSTQADRETISRGRFLQTYP